MRRQRSTVTFDYVLTPLTPQQDALFYLYVLERSAEHDDSVLWATCGELLVRLWPTVCGGADASPEQVGSMCTSSLSAPCGALAAVISSACRQARSMCTASTRMGGGL